MPLTTIPEKTETSLGIEKQDVLPYTDPNTQVPAVQYERLKDAVIASALAIGLGDGSTAGSIEARLAGLGSVPMPIFANTYVPAFTPSEPGNTYIAPIGAFMYQRIGNFLKVWGLVEINTAGITTTPAQSCKISLPVPCPSSSLEFCAGSYVGPHNTSMRGPIFGETDPTEAKAVMRSLADSGGVVIVSIELGYRTTA